MDTVKKEITPQSSQVGSLHQIKSIKCLTRWIICLLVSYRKTLSHFCMWRAVSFLHHSQWSATLLLISMWTFWPESSPKPTHLLSVPKSDSARFQGFIFPGKMSCFVSCKCVFYRLDYKWDSFLLSGQNYSVFIFASKYKSKK